MPKWEDRLYCSFHVCAEKLKEMQQEKNKAKDVSEQTDGVSLRKGEKRVIVLSQYWLTWDYEKKLNY